MANTGIESPESYTTKGGGFTSPESYVQRNVTGVYFECDEDGGGPGEPQPRPVEGQLWPRLG